MSIKSIVRGLVVACCAALGLNAWADLSTDFTQVTSMPENWIGMNAGSAGDFFSFGNNGAIVKSQWGSNALVTRYNIPSTEKVTIDVSTYSDNNSDRNVVLFLASKGYSVAIGNSYKNDTNIKFGSYAGDATTGYICFQQGAAMRPDQSTVKELAASDALTIAGPLTYHLEIEGTSLKGSVTDGKIETPIAFSIDLPSVVDFTAFGVSLGGPTGTVGVKSVSINGGSPYVRKCLEVKENVTMTPADIEGEYDEVKIFENVTLTIDVADASSVSLPISGAGKLAKIGDGTLTLSNGNSFTGGTTISAGAIALGANNALGAAGSAVTVGEGATLDINGKQDYLLAITLDGGTLKNGGGNISTDKAQIKSLTLTKDSTVIANGNFGIVNSGHAATTLTLNEHKLTKQGSAEFWLVTVTSDTGTIQIDAGTIHVDRYQSTLAGVAFALPADATDMIIQNATEVNPAPAGTVYQQVERQGGETIYITTGVGSYVLAAGNAATLKDGDVIAFDSHYKGEKWGSAPSFSNFAGHKVIVDVEMNINGGIQENQEVEINAQDYIRGNIGAGASIEGTGSVYVGYSTSDVIYASTISAAKFGFQNNGNTYTAVIGGMVVVGGDTEILEGGDDDHFQLIEGGSLTVPTKLSDGKVISGVDGYTVKINEGKVLISYSLEKTVTYPGEIAKGSLEQKAAYDKWAEGLDLSGLTDDDQIINRFILNVGPEETDEDLKDLLGGMITSTMLAELMAQTADGGEPVPFKVSGLQGTFLFVQVPETEIETSAKLYRLTATFVPDTTEQD